MTLLEINDNLHDINAPIVKPEICLRCDKKLEVGINWCKSYFERNYRVCSECHKEYCKEWRKNNVKKRNEYEQKIVRKFRNIAIRANKNCKTETTYKHLICLFCSGYSICPYTEIKINLKKMHLEHIKAKTNGGDNEHTNLVFVSPNYNTAKNGYLIDDFVAGMGKLINKDQMLVAKETIVKIHNRYEFMIDSFLEMTDDELTEQVELTLKNRIRKTVYTD